MEILFYCWVFFSLYLIFHYLWFHGRLVFHAENAGTFNRGVSVVICAHNEEENLKQNLPKILVQEYGEFEVLVVDDHSTDGTKKVLEVHSRQFPRLRALNFEAEKKSRGKKEALMFGIENARYPYMVFTDADCAPATKGWLGTMCSQFDRKEIALGVSPYIFKDSIAGRLTRWETFLTSQQYLSFAKAGIPYMGVGRNLAYTKDVYERSSKMKDHLHLPSGDDDLLISEVAQAQNVAVILDSNASTYSDAPETLKQWWGQKRRHLSTSYHYKAGPAFFLAMFGISQLGFYALLIPVIFFFWNNPLFQIMLWGKLVLQYLTMGPFAIKTKQTGALSLFFVIEPLVVMLLAIIHFQNKLSGNSKNW